jgi:TolA-binding protein
MPLKAVVETLDEVSPEFQGEYKEATIKIAGQDKQVYVLDVTDVDSHPTVINLKTAFERTKREKQALVTDIAALKKRVGNLPEDFDPDSVEAMHTELEDLRQRVAAGGGNKDHQAELQRLKHQIEALEGEKEELSGQVKKLVVDEGLTKALVAVGVKPSFLKAAKAMLRDSVKVETEGGSPRAVIETDLGPQPLEQFVATWAGSDDGKEFVEKAKGSGADGSNGKDKGGGPSGNPWMKDSRNVTEQGRIVREDKPKAARLMKAAGISDQQIRQVTGIGA